MKVIQDGARFQIWSPDDHLIATYLDRPSDGALTMMYDAFEAGRSVGREEVAGPIRAALNIESREQ